MPQVQPSNCQKNVMKVCAKFKLSFGCNDGALCRGSHSEATSKLQENQTTFARLYKQTIEGKIVRLSCHRMVIYDDHLKHR